MDFQVNFREKKLKTQHNTTTQALMQHLGGGLAPPVDVRVLAVYTSSMHQAY